MLKFKETYIYFNANFPKICKTFKFLHLCLFIVQILSLSTKFVWVYLYLIYLVLSMENYVNSFQNEYYRIKLKNLIFSVGEII